VADRTLRLEDGGAGSGISLGKRAFIADCASKCEESQGCEASAVHGDVSI
jgi:hypothetical protein